MEEVDFSGPLHTMAEGVQVTLLIPRENWENRIVVDEIYLALSSGLVVPYLLDAGREK